MSQMGLLEVREWALRANDNGQTIDSITCEGPDSPDDNQLCMIGYLVR